MVIKFLRYISRPVTSVLTSTYTLCVFLTKFLQVFDIDTQKIAHEKNACQLSRPIQNWTCSVTCEEKNHTSLDIIEIEMTRTTRCVTLK